MVRQRPGKRCVREGGEVLQRVDVDRGAFACMLGGGDGKSLFIAAAQWKGMDAIGDGSRTGQVLVAQVDIPHAGLPGERDHAPDATQLCRRDGAPVDGAAETNRTKTPALPCGCPATG